MDILTYALAKSYTDKALLGVGTIKGAPCTVKSQTEDDEYVYVTLGWENNLGTSEETVVKIKKGADGVPGEPGPAGDPGPQGVSITKIEKIKTEGLIDTYQISFSDNTTFEYTISNGSTDYLNITNKPSIEGVELTGNKTFEDLNIASADSLTATNENLQNLSNLIGDKTSLPTPTDTVVNNITSVDAKVDAIIDDNEAGLTKTFSSDKITKTFVTKTELNEKGYLTEHQDISGKVDKEEGKSLIADSEITRLSTVKNYDDSVVKEDIATIKTDYATKTYVGEQIAAADHLKREIVTEIPTAETAVENVIYMLKVESAIGADKYKEYMLIDGEVACVGDTSVDLTDYAKKSEIPTELPANGGNSDTVNNHTVETDVPIDAKFTDTIYDDTEIKYNLSTLKYDNAHGGENLCSGLDFVNAITGTGLSNITVDEMQGTIRFSQNNSSNYKNNGFIISDSDYNFKENTQYSVILTGFSEDSTNLSSSICIWYTDGNYYSIDLKGTTKETVSYTSIASKTVKSIKYEYVGQNYKVLYYNECGVFEGVVSEDDFRPYIPSVKTLAEENRQQSNNIMDMKMLGWTVPSECPIQNYVDSDGVFHQIVGRVDLGSLEFTVQTAYNRIITAVAVDSIKSVISTNLPNAYTDYCRTETSSNAWHYKETIDRCLVIESKTPADVSIYSPPSDLSELKGHYLYYELAQPITMTIDGNEVTERINENLSVIGKCKNLLNSTLQTITQNGVTCTNNGDGTYTLNGTSTSDSWFTLGKAKLYSGRTYRLCGLKRVNNSTMYIQLGKANIITQTTNNGIDVNITETSKDYLVVAFIPGNATYNNVIYKPMITTDLNATYDDFVPYTGNGETLTHDVAAIKKDIGNLTGDIDAKTVNGHTVESNVPANAKFTDTVYDDTSIQNKLTTHTHDDRYYTETEVNNLLNGKANSSHSHGAYELPVGSIFLSNRKVAPSYGNWEYLGTIQSLFSDLPLVQAIGEGYVYNRTS